MCFFCRPTCDNCKPKRVTCPKCGKRAFLVLEACPKCGYAFTDEDRSKAKDDWATTHIQEHKG